jgi:type IV pilus assembly protein PilE
MIKQKEVGFTLIELMITIVIIGILAAIAYPSYLKQVKKSRRSDGESTLMSVMQAEERYFSSNLTYVTDTSKLDNYSTNPVVSDGSYYKIAASKCASPNDTLTACILLTATPQGAQAGDGNLTLDSLGNQSW